MPIRSQAPLLLALGLPLLAGCHGHRIHDRSPDPVPEPLVLTAPLGTRVACTALTGQSGGPPVPWVDRERRERLIALREITIAEEVAALLRGARAFRSIEARSAGEGELEVVFTERIREAPLPRDGTARQTTTLLLWLTPALPVLLALDLIHLDHGEVRATYSLACRAPDGEVIARYETTSVLGVEEQAFGCPRTDLDRPWLGHGPVLRQARERAQRVLVGALVRDWRAQARIRDRLESPREARR